MIVDLSGYLWSGCGGLRCLSSSLSSSLLTSLSRVRRFGVSPRDREITVTAGRLHCCSMLIVRSSECSVLDGDLKQVSDEIAKYSADLLKPTGSTKYSNSTMQILRDKYNVLLLKKQNEFADKKCRDVLEKQNLNESGYLLSTQAEKQEQNVLPSNYKEQYLYIGLGSVVLLTGLYIISKK